MIEKRIIDYLKNCLSVPVFLEIPESAPEEFVLFERTGSSENYNVITATFAFQSYATSMFKAATLNDEVKKALREMIQLNDVIKVSLNSDYNFTDITTKRYRYQAVFDISYYEN